MVVAARCARGYIKGIGWSGTKVLGRLSFEGEVKRCRHGSGGIDSSGWLNRGMAG